MLSGLRYWVLSLACEISFLFNLLARQLGLCCLAQDTESFLVWLVRLASSSTGWRDSLLFVACSRHWVLLSLCCQISFLFNWLARQLALFCLAYTGSFLVWLVRLASSSTCWRDSLLFFCLAQDTGSLVWLVRLASSSTGWRDSLFFVVWLKTLGPS